MSCILRTTILSTFLFTLALPASALTITAGSFEISVPSEDTHTFSSIRTRILSKSPRPSEIENIYYCPIPVFCGDVFLSRRVRETTSVIVDRNANLTAIGQYLDSVAEKVRQVPKDAVFGEDEARNVMLLEASVTGQELNRKDALLALAHAIESGADHTTLPVITTPPTISDTAPDELGFRKLIAEGTTNFSGSTRSRIHNIRRALEQYHGLLIAPGEEFSFVEYLGEVDGEHGYLPELVIKHDRTEPEYGGGICQVSSTMFRAAINAGFQITERRNHAYPVHYYKPYGMDATVYIPKPDLRFVNNTPGHILIQAGIEDSDLSFRFYGTDDGRVVEIDGPHILISNPDGSMKTTFSQSVTNAAGETVISDSFESNYKSPDLFPKPEEFTEKPDNWSKRQWREYLAEKEAARSAH